MAFCITEHFSLFHSSSLVYLHHPHATPHYPILCLSAGFHSRVCMAHPWPAGSNGLQMDLLCWWNVDLFCLGDNVDVFFFPCAIWSIIFRWWCWYYIDKEQVFCCLSKEPLCNQATEKKVQFTITEITVFSTISVIKSQEQKCRMLGVSNRLRECVRLSASEAIWKVLALNAKGSVPCRPLRFRSGPLLLCTGAVGEEESESRAQTWNRTAVVVCRGKLLQMVRKVKNKLPYGW